MRTQYKQAQKGLEEIVATCGILKELIGVLPTLDVTHIKQLAHVLQLAIDRNEPKPLDANSRCKACGARVNLLSQGPEDWQFCPVCGQRFRDAWEDIKGETEVSNFDTV